MPSCRAGVMLACALLASGVPGTTRAQSTADWQAGQDAAVRQSQAIMQKAEQQPGLLAQYRILHEAYLGNRNPVFHQVFDQYLAWFQSFLGDYPAASASFSIAQKPQSDDNPSPLSGGYTARPAIQAIADLARPYRAVFFNEAHNVPLTRTLTLQLLGKLRAEGFNYFAAETLSRSDGALQSRGYPIRASGFYTREPISAEMLRTAIRLGYRIVAYEADPDASGDERETEQASNLNRLVFKADPQARLVVNAGYAHIRESGKFLGGQSMAEHFRKLTGIDPLTIEQTVMFPHASADDDHPYYTAVTRKLQPAQPIIFERPDGKPWTLRAGYDVSVFFPAQTLRDGRPTWLDLGGLRRPYHVSALRCLRRFPCLVEARDAGEGEDAIPADRMVLNRAPASLSPGQLIPLAQAVPSGELYLRPGKYRLSYSHVRGGKTSGEIISVSASGN